MSGLRAARELADMSQTELARRMAAKGFNWSQMTVSRREENESTLRWHEGVALREIVGYPSLADPRSRDSSKFDPDYSPEVFEAMYSLLSEAAGSPMRAVRLAVSRLLSTTG
ncbi:MULTISPECIES: helix-turn-helix transcriptional regulator [Microbacterium]|uniref:helix-turn-helix transcriptional regulator n=1 Tax=Microbacterium TaxID=33882 RepID=UPI0028E2C4F6|nr:MULTISPECIES: helix-turn-helix transcriptional regulator [Microbacterium]